MKIKIAIFSLFLASATFAGLQEGEVYGDWKSVCATSEAGHTLCALEQELRDESDQPVARVSIVRSKTSEIIANVKVPLLVNLQAGLGLGVDGSLLSQTKFFSCDAEGCMSLVKLDEEKLTRLKKGKVLNVGVYVADQEVNVTASLTGITKGLDNL